jgi:phage gp36-like protein
MDSIMPLLSTTYCTVAEVQRFLSTVGAVAYADHDDDGVADTDVIEDCINQATEEIDGYAGQRHTQAALAGSSLVTRWCVIIASYFLAIRRGNPPPESLALEFNRILDPDSGMLARVATGKYQLPRVALRADLRPTWSNLRIDRRWPNSKIRVTRANSSDAATELEQDHSTEYPSVDG